MSIENTIPEWLSLPAEYKRVVDLNLTYLDPWVFLTDKNFKIWLDGINQRFPSIGLVPFARREDRDDIACWATIGSNEKVYVIHDFSKNGWEKRREYKDFWSWYRQAIEDMIEHEQPYR